MTLKGFTEKSICNRLYNYLFYKVIKFAKVLNFTLQKPFHQLYFL